MTIKSVAIIIPENISETGPPKSHKGTTPSREKISKLT